MIRIPALLLSLLLVQFSIGMSQRIPLIDPLFCKLCELTPLPFPCASRGLEYAVQSHAFTDNDATFSSVDMSYFQKSAPVQRGYTKSIGWIATDPTVTYRIYGGDAISAPYKAVNHRAYFVPPTTGTYKLTASTFDDGLFVWVGPNAYSGKYTRDNADLVQILGQPAQPLEIKGVANTPMALRILFVNGQLGANFVISMTNPDGTVFFDTKRAADTPFFIPYTCDKSSPPFQEWGKETQG